LALSTFQVLNIGFYFHYLNSKVFFSRYCANQLQRKWDKLMKMNIQYEDKERLASVYTMYSHSPMAEQAIRYAFQACY